MKKIILIFLIGLHAHGAFDNTSMRFYMAGDFYNKIITLLPNADRPGFYFTYNGNDTNFQGGYNPQSGLDCIRNTFSSRSTQLTALGIISPITGEATTTSPDMGTVNTLVKCGKAIVESELSVLNPLLNPLTDSEPVLKMVVSGDQSSNSELVKDTLERIFPLYEKDYQGDGKAFVHKIRSYIDFKNPQVVAHTLHLIHYMLGPDPVIAEYGVAKNAEEIATAFLAEAEEKKKLMTLQNYTAWVLTNLIIRDEFLTF